MLYFMAIVHEYLQIHVVTSVDAGSLPGVTDYQHSKHEMMYGCLLGIKGTYG